MSGVPPTSLRPQKPPNTPQHLVRFKGASRGVVDAGRGCGARAAHQSSLTSAQAREAGCVNTNALK